MTPPNGTRVRHARTAVLLAGLTTACLTGCQLTGGGADRGAAAWSKTCPRGKKVAAELAVDVSGSYAVADVSGDFEQALRDLTARVAMCGGHLRVRFFSGSNAGSVVAFDRDVAVIGATAAARARRVPAAQTAVITEVESQLPVDLSDMAAGSDIVGQLAAQAQYVEQLGDDYVLDGVVLTDGEDNRTLPPKVLADTHSAEQAAKRLPVPDLPGAWVTIAGLGEVEGQPRSSTETATLIGFYTALCERTGAEKCVAVSDYVSSVGG